MLDFIHEGSGAQDKLLGGNRRGVTDGGEEEAGPLETEQ